MGVNLVNLTKTIHSNGDSTHQTHQSIGSTYENKSTAENMLDHFGLDGGSVYMLGIGSIYQL